jgi:hypothetical protein
VGLVADQVPSLLRRFFFSLSPASTPSEVIGLSHSSIHPSSRELKKGQTTLQYSTEKKKTKLVNRHLLALVALGNSDSIVSAELNLLASFFPCAASIVNATSSSHVVHVKHVNLSSSKGLDMSLAAAILTLHAPTPTP